MLETVLSIATLAGLLWVARVLVPRAAQENDRFALTCAVVALILAIVLWLLVGVTRVSAVVQTDGTVAAPYWQEVTRARAASRDVVR